MGPSPPDLYGIEMKPQNRSVTALSQLLDARDGLHRALGIARTIGHVAGDSDLTNFQQRTLTDDKLLHTTVPRPRRKSFAFVMAFLALAIVAFVSTLDATTLSVALPASMIRRGST